jgi:hypothetical protein
LPINKNLIEKKFISTKIIKIYISGLCIRVNK